MILAMDTEGNTWRKIDGLVVLLIISRKVCKHMEVPLQHFTRKYSGYHLFPKEWQCKQSLGQLTKVNKMKDNLGSEVLLTVEALSEDNFATTDSLRASDCNWSASRCRPEALRCIRTWGIMKDGQGCHHLPPTPQPWDMRQMKVMCSLDTTSTLTSTNLALARNFRLYQESSIRAPTTRTDDEPTSKQ